MIHNPTPEEAIRTISYLRPVEAMVLEKEITRLASMVARAEIELAKRDGQQSLGLEV